ncbi:MAG: 4-phosphopantoate--beta-alanine ligase [Methanobacterium sp.]|nr:4-phosphopantoate--beta-alanine ligase [Methanobacterium sp.]
MIHKDHPRYESLKLRAMIVNAHKIGILADSGMIAHGRGEAFDYLISEKTSSNAIKAVKAAAAALLLAENPVISVNGNTAALVPEKIVKLAKEIPSQIEINLFYRTDKRINVIEKVLKNAGAENILGTNQDEKAIIKGLDGPRSYSSKNGIYIADVVLIPLEDGDRAEALTKLGKLLITIDLNPLSRTAKTSNITIVDNIVRAIPNLIKAIKELRDTDPLVLHVIVENFDNKENLQKTLENISKNYTGVNK